VVKEQSVKDYMILVASSSRDLSKHVRAAMAEGWVPQGGVAHTNGGGTPWAQAMVLADVAQPSRTF
jgi:hypothetical protein